MIPYQTIRSVHLEISSLCNARCPLCPRNLYGYPYNSGYTENNLTLKDIQTIFTPDFLGQLSSVHMIGNFGDFIMNPESLEIVQYFSNTNPELYMFVGSNASARDQDFWSELAKVKNLKFEFCIDGLADTHHLYRQNTSWDTIINNAKTFINAGGNAKWKFIKFKHNQHQIQQCEQLANTLGFSEFEVYDEGRNTGPVFDKQGNYLHALGDYTGETDITKVLEQASTGMMLLEDLSQQNSPKTTVSCKAKNNQSIFISSTGDVSPCCWLGIDPKTYGKGRYHEPCNKQVAPMIQKNNVFEHSLQECLEWFADVEKSWKIESYQDGRLLICDDYCGSNECAQ
jgi:MoaA/NifB/PqqE/SkfB family radical SAM enzyme